MQIVLGHTGNGQESNRSIDVTLQFQLAGHTELDHERKESGDVKHDSLSGIGAPCIRIKFHVPGFTNLPGFTNQRAGKIRSSRRIWSPEQLPFAPPKGRQLRQRTRTVKRKASRRLEERDFRSRVPFGVARSSTSSGGGAPQHSPRPDLAPEPYDMYIARTEGKCGIVICADCTKGTLVRETR